MHNKLDLYELIAAIVNSVIVVVLSAVFIAKEEQMYKRPWLLSIALGVGILALIVTVTCLVLYILDIKRNNGK